jgi:hypothetical protein
MKKVEEMTMIKIIDKTMKNIFKCTRCKGRKVRTRTRGMICVECEIPKLIEEEPQMHKSRIKPTTPKEKRDFTKLLKKLNK